MKSPSRTKALARVASAAVSSLAVVALLAAGGCSRETTAPPLSVGGLMGTIHAANGDNVGGVLVMLTGGSSRGPLMTYSNWDDDRFAIGVYQFGPIFPGRWHVQVVPPDGYSVAEGQPGAADVSVLQGRTTVQDFTLVATPATAGARSRAAP